MQRRVGCTLVQMLGGGLWIVLVVGVGGWSLEGEGRIGDRKSQSQMKADADADHPTEQPSLPGHTPHIPLALC